VPVHEKRCSRFNGKNGHAPCSQAAFGDAIVLATRPDGIAALARQVVGRGTRGRKAVSALRFPYCDIDEPKNAALAWQLSQTMLVASARV
jgi:hypothetical protein